ncbi:SDR family NAD(P)-dependent oxidoreductase [Sphingomonas xanthus]|uniref:SDR family oxidoreductase n=1 Tax=Sphingomonas xanthus TaxID=2594473 RepID=A0A516ISB1_9SPHN|nr:SDR family oxidoreductase [Sphingomonas xanthus]QDP19791.1 SDR family oxidoreductase [Sphingomonas xanthus]
MQAKHGFDGRHALITGGGTGIGAATATALHSGGAKLSLLGRRIEPLERTASATGGAAIACDVTDLAKVEEAFGEARAANGPVSMLIVNAGVGDSAPFARTGRDSWDRIIATNLTSAFDCVQAALPDLLAGKDSRIVFVASIAGLKGAAYAAPYAASKHGLIGLMRSLAVEFATSGMTVNAVCPAFVDTPMVDDSVARIARVSRRSDEEARASLAAMNRHGQLIDPAGVASMIAWLCRPEARDVNGAALTIDGGTTA